MAISDASVKKHRSTIITGETYLAYYWSVILYNKGNADGRVKVSVCAPPAGCQTNLGESDWVIVSPSSFRSVSGSTSESASLPDLNQAVVNVWQDLGAQGSVLVDSWQVNIEPGY
ncbi:MAG: hypothetical protein IMX02_06235 [Limnochordaceae bacterium]|nr:hypothetical protein [Limnochordaceae bacterium]